MLWRTFEDWIKVPGASTWPGQKDLDAGAVFINERLVSEIEQRLQARSATLLLGAEGRGKTTLAKVLAYRRSKAGQKVHVIDCRVGDATSAALAAAIASRDALSPLWIFDDCQHDEEGVTELVESVQRAIKSRFLFLMRAIPSSGDYERDGDVFDRIVKDHDRLLLQPDIQTLREIIAKYIQEHKTRFQRPPQLGAQDLEHAHELTGGNLRALRAYLDAWNPAQEPFETLQPETIAQLIEATRLRPLLKLGGTILKTYATASAIGQLDAGVRADTLSLSDLTELEERALLGREGALYRLPHAADGRLTIEAYSRMVALPANVVTERLLREYLDQQATSASQHGILRAIAASANSEFSPSFVEELADRCVATKDLRLIGLFIRTYCKDPTDVGKLAAQMGGPSVVATLFMSSNMVFVRGFLGAVRLKDARLAVELEGQLTVQDKIDLYRKSPMRTVATSLTSYVNQRSFRFAKAILGEVLNDSFEERVKRSSVGSCGRLLEVAWKLDHGLAQRAARCIAEHAVIAEAENSERLGLLLTHSGRDGAAKQRLVERIVLECEPGRLLSKEKRRGYTYLLGLLYPTISVTPQLLRKGRQFFDQFAAMADDGTTSELTDKEVAITMWQLMLMKSDASGWLKRARKDMTRRIESSSSEGLFWILQNVWQADEALFRNWLSVYGQSLRSRIERRGEGLERLPLIGLLADAGWKIGKSTLADPPEAVVGELRKGRRESAAWLLYGLNGVYEQDQTQFGQVCSALAAQGISLPHIQQLIERNPIRESHGRLQALAERLLN